MIFKSRQIGLTTTMAGVANWLATFFESTRIMALSQKEKDAFKIISKIRFLNENHPDWMRLKIDPDQSGMIGYPATHAFVEALPSTEDAGRSTDATLVFTDEWEIQEYAEQNFAAIKPTMDRGGLFIGVSTIKKTDFTTFPKRVWWGAKDGTNGFVPLFFGYFVVPDRTQETYLSAVAGLPEWQVEQEYPRNEEECFAIPQSTCFFDRKALDEMLAEVEYIKPIEERYGGKIRIYKHPVVGRKYCLVSDPSEGQDDPSACIVQDWATEEDVACLHGKMSLDEQAKLIWELYQEYNEPFTSVERNAGGLTLIEKLRNAGVDNWYYCKTDKEGWWTQSSNRPVMLNEVAEAISQRLIRIPMKDAISEFYDFQWIEGKPQAVVGRHDDWVMVHAQMHQIRKEYNRKKGIAKAVSFKYTQSF